MSKTGTVRPLGVVRLKKSEPHDIGKIVGCSMQIPPQKEKDTYRKEDRVTPPSNYSSKRSSISSISSNGDIGEKTCINCKGEKEKESQLKNALAREKKLKQKVVEFEKLASKSKEEISSQVITIEQLTSELNSNLEQCSSWKEKYEREKAAHEETKCSLTSVEMDLDTLKQQHENLKISHAKEIQQLKDTLEKKIRDLEEKYKKELDERDQKLARLKRQMADSLQGNSWERQQQLEELTKELSRIQDEAETLRMKLKQSRRASQDCQMCQSLSAKLEAANKTIKEKNKLMNELRTKLDKS
ncbi:uncharacterized protein LOC141900034 [Tubulanus polymorphus]|uniref:uncharacterized protein LOC141900034 n=1 Tax=Tubulanus polymorphus TaxID=672921 RepID=UPI003DA409A4